MMLRFLPLLMLPLVGFAQTNSNGEMPMDATTTSEKQPLEIKRNAQYNLEEIKVRWKKAALENCTGVPCIVAPSFTCGTTTISDIDGNSYNTVQIGTQCWTKQNLKVTKYNDGTAIPLDASGGLDGITGGQTWTNLTTGAYTIYENLTSNAATNGFLYNWYAASDSKKICPAGWHVPSEKEFDSLILFIDPSFFSYIVSSEVKKLKVKAPSLWSLDDGTDDFGFSALPSGFRVGDVGLPVFDGKFVGVTLFAHFWTVTKTSANVGTRRLSTGSIDYLPQVKSAGNSIRCLKD